MPVRHPRARGILRCVARNVFALLPRLQGRSHSSATSASEEVRGCDDFAAALLDQSAAFRRRVILSAAASYRAHDFAT